jgi:hypothetical protein
LANPSNACWCDAQYRGEEFSVVTEEDTAKVAQKKGIFHVFRGHTAPYHYQNRKATQATIETRGIIQRIIDFLHSIVDKNFKPKRSEVTIHTGHLTDFANLPLPTNQEDRMSELATRCLIKRNGGGMVYVFLKKAR